jgi:hypothetical protein
MARRNWTKCPCGVKLHIKKKRRLCYVCEHKVRKGKLELDTHGARRF